jgi:phage-related protein
MNILKINGQALEGIYVDAAISFNKPAKRVSTYSVPGRNGDLVIDEGTFDNVLITYPVFEKSTFPTEFDAIVNYLASLEGYQRIECSNDPQHYRLGRFVVPQNPTAKRLNRDGYWQLSFDCKPQRWLLSGEEDTEIDANPIDEYSGDIVSIDAVALDEITELKANIEPVQNLNGQTSPYPAGGGKNKVPVGANKDGSGITYTVNADGTVKATGTATATTFWGVQFTIPAGSYILNGCPSGGSASSYYMDIRNAVGGAGIAGISADTGNGSAFTLTEALTAYVNIRTANGYAYPTGGLVFKPMIRLATDTDPTFAPYSNICPISGHTECKVVRTGVNIWDEEWLAGTYATTTGNYNDDGTARICSKNKIPCKPNTTYYMKGNCNFRFYDANENFIGTLGTTQNNTFTTPDNCYFMNIVTATGYGRTYLGDISINYPSTDHDYHAYAGQTYPISLGQTVYGGTLNPITGVLTINMASVTVTNIINGYARQNGDIVGWFVEDAYADSNTTPANIICSLASAEGANYQYTRNTTSVAVNKDNNRGLICVAGITTKEALNTWLAANAPQVVYELATPTTVQLTAAEVELLLGQNNIWADTGDVEVKVTSPTVFNNPSPFNSKPLIRVYGIGTFRVNDITVTIASHDKPYIDIDCELQECYYGSENMNEYVSFSGNDFPELEPGNNYMLLASGITKLIVTPRWWVL